MDHLIELASRAYQAYVESAAGVSVHGEKLPAWEAVDGVVQAHWIVAARAIRNATACARPCCLELAGGLT